MLLYDQKTFLRTNNRYVMYQNDYSRFRSVMFEIQPFGIITRFLLLTGDTTIRLTLGQFLVLTTLIGF